MPRITADAPDLAISQDGAWLARLDGGLLRLYDLSAPEGLAEPAMELEHTGAGGQGHLGFCAPERLLCLTPIPAEEDEDSEGILAVLLDVPTLEPLSRIAVPGARRVLGIGTAGAVVAPMAAGADVISVRGTDLSLDQTFLRGDVLSAAPAPERRWLIEQRGGHELWDAATRRITAHLTLSTRQPLQQVGFGGGGKLIWTLAAGVPVHLEFFRFSDGRRLYEIDEPGRPLRAEAGGGRLIVAIGGEGSGVRFLDVDLGDNDLRRAAGPEGPLLAFALRPSGATPEIIALIGGDEPRFERVPLERIAAPAEAPEPQRPGRVSPFLSRQEGRLDRGEAQGERRPPTRARVGETRRATLRRPGDDLRPALGPRPRPRPEELPELAAPREDEGPELEGDEAQEPMPQAAAVPRLGLGRPLRRSEGGAAGPGAWQWEVARWAQLLLAENPEEIAPSPPAGGPLAALGARLQLSPLGQKIVALVYALEHLAGSHPRGLAPLEIAQALGVIHDEALILGELLQDAPLLRHAVLRRGRGGQLRLSPAVADLLGGAQLSGLLVSGGAPRSGGQRLDTALYLVSQYAAPTLTALGAAVSQPILRVDCLGEEAPLLLLRRALRRAQLHGAAVLVEGLAGVAHPVFSGDARAAALRRLLLQPRVPLLVVGAAATIAGLGLPGRLLPVALPPSEAPAPTLPSAPLPPGTLWRPARPPSRAAFLDGTASIPGRLEPLTAGDPRAAILLGPTATPDDYARAAALAARDGAVLALDGPLTSARAAVLSVLLRQVPATVLIPPPADGLPPELARLVE